MSEPTCLGAPGGERQFTEASGGAHSLDGAEGGTLHPSAGTAGAGGDAPDRPERLGSYAVWPIPNLQGSGLPREQEFEAVSAELVLDKITGLMWQRTDTGEPRSLSEARADCEALAVDGWSDFRLPSRLELVTLADTRQSPALDPDWFPGARADYHRSATVAPSEPDSAYSMYLGDGALVIGLADVQAAFVRCVRGPAPALGPRFVVTTDRAEDPATGLVWSRSVLTPLSWEEAQVACEESGGRLPSLRELSSIVDDARYGPATDDAAFPGTPALPHWTSTVRDAGELLPWTIDFEDGKSAYGDQPTALHPARCLLSEEEPTP